MLFTMLGYLIVTTACFLAGFIFYDILLKSERRNPIIYLITGLILITSISQIASLFTGVTNLLGIIIILTIIVICLKFRKELVRRLKTLSNYGTLKNKTYTILFITAAITVLTINSGPVIMDDTESYHIQIIRWIKEYGVVPGIANLHSRYGFHSSWFSTIAVFKIFPDTASSYTLLNGLVSIWTSYYLINRAATTEPSIKTAALCTLLISLVSWPILRGNAASSNYDNISMLLIAVLLIEYMLKPSHIPKAEWLIWPTFLITIRVTNSPILLLTGLILFLLIKYRKFKQIALYILVAVLMVIPFLATNVVSSGYLLFPSPFLDFFEPDWKTPPAVGEGLMHYIKYYNRVSTGYMNIEDTEKLNGLRWVPLWFKYTSSFNKIIIFSGIAGLFIWIAAISSRKKTLPSIVLLTLILLSLFTWFTIAPDPRFIYGYLIAGTFYLFMKLKLPNKILDILPPILACALSLYTLNKIVAEENYRNWLYPLALPSPPLHEIQVKNITIHLPEKINNNWNARCYDSPLPCLYEIYPGLEPRGNTIKEGFRIRK